MRIQFLLGIFLFLTQCVYAQKADSLSAKLDQGVSFPGRFFSRMQAKSQDLNNSLDRQPINIYKGSREKKINSAAAWQRRIQQLQHGLLKRPPLIRIIPNG